MITKQITVTTGVIKQICDNCYIHVSLITLKSTAKYINDETTSHWYRQFLEWWLQQSCKDWKKSYLLISNLLDLKNSTVSSITLSLELKSSERKKNKKKNCQFWIFQNIVLRKNRNQRSPGCDAYKSFFWNFPTIISVHFIWNCEHTLQFNRLWNNEE